MSQAPGPFDTDDITGAANSIVKHADSLGLRSESTVAALSVAAEVVRQRLNGQIQAMVLAALLTRR